jgi:RNA polymerase sigma-70 factor (ECF subfamily)
MPKQKAKSPREKRSKKTNSESETPVKNKKPRFDDDFEENEKTEVGDNPESDEADNAPEELPQEAAEGLKEVEAEIAKDDKPTSREEDYQLIDDIRDGDAAAREHAYKRLLSKYKNQIFSLILKIVHTPNEVEDLVQETFSKAFNSIGNFNKEYAFSTWLYRIATNSSIDYLRKRRLKTYSIDTPIQTKDDEYYVEIADSREEPGKNIIQSQRDHIVREAIAQLPEKYRVVIEMRHLQERTYDEISAELDIPLGTVKAHIFRAREMLYKMLRDKLRSY